MLKDKKILFIAPSFFNYPELIRSGIESQQAKVDFFCCRPVSLGSKLISVLSTGLTEALNERYLKTLFKKAKGPYDYVLIIRADLIPEELLALLKLKNQDSVFIQYLWDDVGLIPSVVKSFRYFDRILTYSIHDSKNFDLVFRPFFFIPDDTGKPKDISKKYDLFFIGVFHTDRLQVLERIRILNGELRILFHFYINPLTFLKQGIPFRNLKYFKFGKMEYDEMIRVIKSSCSILDIPKPGQQGLTTRIIEALGAGVKVVTTNEKVRDYDFYNENNFLIIDRDNPIVDGKWAVLPFKKYDSRYLSGFQISSWINDVFTK